MNSKSVKRISAAVWAAIGFGVAGSEAYGQTLVVKDNNTNALNTSASWVGGVLPGPSNIALWDSTVTTGQSVSVGAVTIVGGIKIGSSATGNPGGDITITNNTLTIGSGGINLSESTVNLSVSSVVRLSGDQSWSVAANKAVTLSGSATQSAVADGSTSHLTLQSGTYHLSAANLNLGQGITTSASLTLLSGSNLTIGVPGVVNASLTVGQGDGSNATVTIKDGATLNVSQQIIMTAAAVTNQSTSTINQEGGMVTSGAVLALARGSVAGSLKVNSVYNLSGGTLQTGGLAWSNANSAQTTNFSTMNLDGGRFRAPSFGMGGNLQGNETLNFNGTHIEFIGTQDAALGAANFNAMRVKAGGAIIEIADVARTITVASGLLHADDAGGLRKLGAGKLLLQANNTYTGNTTVSGGNVELTSTGSLRFDINDGSSTQVLGVAGGTETLTLRGALRLDHTSVSGPGSWQLIDDDLTTVYDNSTFGISFLTGQVFTTADLGETWTYTDSYGTYTFTQDTGMLVTNAPEPGTACLLLGTTALLLQRRRRNSS